MLKKYPADIIYVSYTYGKTPKEAINATFWFTNNVY